jgi:hypothetical protein
MLEGYQKGPAFFPPYWFGMLAGTVAGLIFGGIFLVINLKFRLGGAIAVPFLVAFAIVFKKSQKRLSRHYYGLCTYCGYDLHLAGERCPECGRVQNGKPVAQEVHYKGKEAGYIGVLQPAKQMQYEFQPIRFGGSFNALAAAIRDGKSPVVQVGNGEHKGSMLAVEITNQSITLRANE